MTERFCWLVTYILVLFLIARKYQALSNTREMITAHECISWERTREANQFSASLHVEWGYIIMFLIFKCHWFIVDGCINGIVEAVCLSCFWCVCVWVFFLTQTLRICSLVWIYFVSTFSIWRLFLQLIPPPPSKRKKSSVLWESLQISMKGYSPKRCTILCHDENNVILWKHQTFISKQVLTYCMWSSGAEGCYFTWKEETEVIGFDIQTLQNWQISCHALVSMLRV